MEVKMAMGSRFLPVEVPVYVTADRLSIADAFPVLFLSLVGVQIIKGAARNYGCIDRAGNSSGK
jgi:hypothetical protein